MPLSLFDARTKRDCKWPVEGSGAAMLVCGEPVRPRCIWCEEHAQRGFASADSPAYRDGLGNPHKKKTT